MALLDTQRLFSSPCHFTPVNTDGELGSAETPSCPGQDGLFSYYFICKSNYRGTGEPCHRIVYWGKWTSSGVEMGNTQRMYCPFCNTKYKTSFGILVEILAHGKTFYCLADFPPDCFFSYGTLLVQTTRLKVNTPEELLAVFPNMTPASAVRLAMESEGVYNIVVGYQDLAAKGFLNWSLVYHVPERKPRRKRTASPPGPITSEEPVTDVTVVAD
jgi:hypothetical protein